MDLILREAKLEDCDDLYHWKNDPVSREQSFNREEVSYEEHCGWLKEALKDSNRLFYIGIDDKNEKCGVARFDIKDEFFAEVHINIAPEKRRKGIGSQLISKSCPLFFLKTKRKLIMARTKEWNTVSIKTFKKVGFSELLCYNDTEWRGVVVLVLLTPDGGRQDENPLSGQQSNRAECSKVAEDKGGKYNWTGNSSSRKGKVCQRDAKDFRTDERNDISRKWD